MYSNLVIFHVVPADELRSFYNVPSCCSVVKKLEFSCSHIYGDVLLVKMPWLKQWVFSHVESPSLCSLREMAVDLKGSLGW